MRGDREALRLDAIWSALPEDRWITREALKEATGTDDITLIRAINFLTRWNFIETRTTPEPQIRRREGAIDPTKAVEQLREVTANRRLPTTLTETVPNVASQEKWHIHLSFHLFYLGLSGRI